MQLTIISGASSGIGAALAEHAHTDGHRVATISRRPGPGTFLEADLSSPDSWPEVAEWMSSLIGSDQWDRVVFIHNSGMIEPIGFAGDTDATAYTTNVLLNAAAAPVLGAAFLAAAKAIPSHLMLVSSGAGRRPIKGWSSYCAGKAATDMWARTAGMEQQFRDGNVTVTSVAPGVVDTAMQGVIRGEGTDSFPDVGNFVDLKESGSLRSPHEVARTLLAITATDAGGTFGGVKIENGALLSIDDFAAAS